MQALRAQQRLAQQLKGSGGSLMQRRFVGDLPVKPNKYIEDWGTFRENVEFTFKFDGRTLRNIAIFAGLVPFTIYQLTCREFDRADAKYGRPQRRMMGHTNEASH